MDPGEELRGLMRQVPAAVAVVTVEVDERRYGLTVGSFVSLSLEPPLVGFAVSRQAQLNELLRETDSLVVSVLAGDQDGIAQHFARNMPPLVLWNGIPLRDGDGPPEIAGALGWLRCTVAEVVEVGTHTFFVCAVAGVEDGSVAAALVHAGGSYHAL